MSPDDDELSPLPHEVRSSLALLRGAHRADEPARDAGERVLARLLARDAQHAAERDARTAAQLPRETRRKSARWFVGAAAGAAALAAVAVLVARSRAPEPTASRVPEPPGPNVVAPKTVRSEQPSALPATSDSPRAAQRHARAVCVKATDDATLIDDFEDGDYRLSPRGARDGRWLFITDLSPVGADTTQAPTELPGGGHVMRLRGPHYRAWGASLEGRLTDSSCYDASRFSGLRFRARGPGRLWVAAREIGVIERRWGGECDFDCYNAHTKRFELGAAWRFVQLRWSDLQARGYDAGALDPSRLWDLQFAVRPEDTPFQLEIDDVEFIR